MIISKITTQKENAERYNVFIKDGETERYAFSVDEAVLAEFQLRKGMEVDELLYDEVMFADDIRRAYNRAIVFLSYRMRSVKEVRDLLKEKEFGESVIQQAVLKLLNQRYLDDEQFAIAYAQTQRNGKKKGRIVIDQELWEKGIAPDIRDRVMADYSLAEEVENAARLVEKAVKKQGKRSQFEWKQLTEQALQRYGFSFEVIRLAFEEAQIDLAEDDDALRKQYEKYAHKYRAYDVFERKMKVKQALYRKGFQLDDIERMMKEEEEV